MRLTRCHVDLPLQPGREFALPERAANHLARVLRLREGDPCVLFNGDGHDYPARLLEVGKREVRAMLQAYQVAGGFEGSILDTSKAEILIDGDKARFAPVEFIGPNDSATLTVVGERVGDQWLITGIGGMSVVELCGAARASNRALEQFGGVVQWQHSYVAADKAFCIYLAPDEERLREHAELSGIPVTRIVEVPLIIDPLTANN